MPVDFTRIQLGDRYDRPTLAQLWGYESYEAISRGVVTQKGSPHIVLFVTWIKQRSSTPYSDYLSGDQLFWEGEEQHQSDDRIASALTDGKAIHLFYREIHHTPFEYKGQVQLTKFDPETERPSRFVFRLLHDQSPVDDLETHAGDLETAPETEREAIAKARLGQGKFRKALLEEWQGCSVTGVFLPSVLRASHIKPWRVSTNFERLDVHNGLLLLPQYDELFDAGLITFSDKGLIRLSKTLRGMPLSLLGVDRQSRLRHLREAHQIYLEYHRSHVFTG
jgi:putative restriction endonuclease